MVDYFSHVTLQHLDLNCNDTQITGNLQDVSANITRLFLRCTSITGTFQDLSQNLTHLALQGLDITDNLENLYHLTKLAQLSLLDMENIQGKST